MSSGYWAENMVCPARSADTLNGVLTGEGEKEKTAFILVEIGPHPFENAGLGG
jgi:hypothetical protein